MSTMENAGGIPQWTLGDRLRKARETAGVSVEEMAADIGRSERTVRNYENETTRAPLLVIRQYGFRCRVPFEWLNGGPGPDQGDTMPVTIGYPAGLRVAA